MTHIVQNKTFYLPLPKSPIVCRCVSDTDRSDIQVHQYLSGDYKSTRPVKITKVLLEICEGMIELDDMKPHLYIGVYAYFDNKSWDVDKHGLIYEDPIWLHEFNNHMKRINPLMFGSGIDYQYAKDLQGDNFVALEMILKSFPAIKRFDQGLGKIKNLKWLDEKPIFD